MDSDNLHQISSAINFIAGSSSATRDALLVGMFGKLSVIVKILVCMYTRSCAPDFIVPLLLIIA